MKPIAVVQALFALSITTLCLFPFTTDFETDNQDSLVVLNSNFARVTHESPLAGARSMKIDTTQSKEIWNPCFAVGGGLLKPDTDYTLRFTCQMARISNDSFLHVIVRPLDVSSGAFDAGTLNITDIGPANTFRLKFHTRPDGKKWAIQFHGRNKIIALMDHIDIAEGTGERLTPVAEGAVAPAKPRTVPLAQATGCPEFSIDLPKPSVKTASVADFGASPASPDNLAAFAKAIAHCASNGFGRLVVPKGVYRFTNNTTLLFEGLTDFEFDGQGSEFIWLKEKNTLLQISSCQRVLFKNFFIDWDWDKDPLGSVIKIESVAPDGSTLDAVFPDLAAFPRRDMRVAILESLDPTTMSVGREDGYSIGYEFHKGRPDSPPAKYEWLSDNRFRLKAKDGSGQARISNSVRVGDLFRIRHYVYDMVGAHMKDNTNLTLSNVTVYSAPSHAFLSTGEQHHWQFLNTHIRVRPGTKRPLTCSADHHHIGQSMGFFKMIGCDFGLGGDDCLNVHDTTGFTTKTGEKTLTTRNWSPGYYRPGDPIELRHDDYAPTGLTATFRERKGELKGSKVPYELLFDEPLPEPKGKGFILFNRRFGSKNILIRDCYFHDNKARGVLLLASSVTVEGCRFFHNEAGGLKIETGYTFDVWSEGYGASNIVIRNNTFDNVNPIGAYVAERQPTIYMSVYLKSDPSTTKTLFPILNTILVEGNRFINNPGVMAFVCSAGNVTIRSNRVENPTPRKINFPYRGGVAVSHASGVDILDNTFITAPHLPPPALWEDVETSKDIRFEGNQKK